MPGFSLEWQEKKIVDKHLPQPAEISSKVQIEKIPLITASNEYSVKNILIEKVIPSGINFADTLPPKEKHRKNGEFKKFDERKDVTKDHRKTHPLAVISLLLSVYTFSSVIWMLFTSSAGIFGFLFALGIVFSLVAIMFCLLALAEIKKHYDKYEGKALVHAALVLILISPLILLLISVL
jgi:hypothetical protein